MFRNGITNILLRILTLISKFVLVFFMARYLTVEDIGTFGLLSTTISIGLQLIGIDFYLYNTRQLLSSNNMGQQIKDQFIFHLCTYFLILPLFTSVFILNLFPWSYFFIFYFLLIIEHLSQELFRVFVTVSKSSLANFLLYIRSGFWVVFVILVYYFYDYTSLKFIIVSWSIGSLISLVMSVYFLVKIMDFKQLKKPKLKWMLEGVKVSLPFFLSTLALKAIEFSDRYFLKYLSGLNDLGIYTFYTNFSNSVQVFVFTGVISILYPKLIKKYQDGETEDYNNILRRMIIGTILLGIFICIGCILFVKPLIVLMDHQEFLNYYNILYLLLISVSFNLASQICHFVLFAKKNDNFIFISTFITLVINILLNSILISKYGLYGAAYSSILTMLTFFLLKFLGVKYLK